MSEWNKKSSDSNADEKQKPIDDLGSTEKKKHKTDETDPDFKQQYDDLVQATSNCYAVIVGMSGSGKSSCLGVLSKIFVQHNNVDYVSTAQGKINLIKVQNDHGENVTLVDVAGEDFLNWCRYKNIQAPDYACLQGDKNYQNATTTQPALNYMTYFDDLLTNATVIYVVLSASKESGASTDSKAKKAFVILNHYCPKAELTFLINHVDLIKDIEEVCQSENHVKHYCDVKDDAGLTIELHKQVLEYISKDEKSIASLSNYNDNGVKFNVENQSVALQLAQNYVNIIYKNSIKRSFASQSVNPFQLNEPVVRSFKRGGREERYTVIYLLYPTIDFLVRKCDELNAANTQHAFALSKKLGAICSMGIAENNSAYEAAIKNFKEKMRIAFSIECLRKPVWIQDLQQVNSKIKINEEDRIKIDEEITCNESTIKSIDAIIENKRSLIKTDQIRKGNIKPSSEALMKYKPVVLLISLLFLVFTYLYIVGDKEYKLKDAAEVSFQYVNADDIKKPAPFKHLTGDELLNLYTEMMEKYRKSDMINSKPLANDHRKDPRSNSCDALFFAGDGNENPRLKDWQKIINGYTQGNALVIDRIPNDKDIVSELQKYKLNAETEIKCKCKNDKDKCKCEIYKCQWLSEELIDEKIKFANKDAYDNKLIIAKRIKAIYDHMQASDSNWINYIGFSQVYKLEKELLDEIASRKNLTDKFFNVLLPKIDEIKQAERCERLLSNGIFQPGKGSICDNINTSKLKDNTMDAESYFKKVSYKEQRVFCEKNPVKCEKYGFTFDPTIETTSKILRFVFCGCALVLVTLLFKMLIRHTVIAESTLNYSITALEEEVSQLGKEKFKKNHQKQVIKEIRGFLGKEYDDLQKKRVSIEVKINSCK